MSLAKSSRLVEIDALRGVAALAVVLFHYTTRFTDLYKPSALPSISFPGGHYGVNLFFIISGFVIFMTLEKTRRPLDFVVSRFSRLFPAYWAAILLTFVICHWLGLPGKLVDGATALANMTMLHGLFGIPHVDGVYWTLEVELLFYGGMLVLYRLNWLNRVHQVLLALLLVRMVYYVAEHQFGVSLPWIVFKLMILKSIPWFSLGICIYLTTKESMERAWLRPALTASMAIATLWLCESALVAALAAALSGAVFLAANGKLPLLRFWPFVWLGTVSYPLYLLHENIGWSIQLRLLSYGMSLDLTILVALAISLVLAGVLTRFVEQPAMQWIRGRYRSRLNLTRPDLM
jgi:peptidoglycan/LPS O-acetylase OafA/YrhL